MNDTTAEDGAARDRLSGTMRIDIPPDALQATRAVEKPHRRIVTRKTLNLLKHTGGQTAGQGSVPTLGDSDFQELFQNVYDAAIITDMEGNVVDVNVRATTFLHYPAEELRGLSILNIVSGADESLIDTIRTNLVERFILIEACYCRRRDGTFFPAEIAVNQIGLSGSDYLCFFVRDISRRREAEEKLQIEHNAIQNSHSGIAITDLQGLIQYVNSSMCRMWSCGKPEDLVGRDVRSLWRKGMADDEGPVQLITTMERSWIREMVAVRDDATQFDVQIIAALNRDSDDKPVGMVLSFVDISDRKRADEAIRETERQRVMIESLGAACHHLGQPATVLLATLGIMEKRVGGVNGELPGLVSSCLEAAKTLSDVLHKLNDTNEYRTTQYFEDKSGSSTSNRILDI